jgi:hypothetical protein
MGIESNHGRSSLRGRGHAELRDEEGGEPKDKRLLLMEPEFAPVLRVMQRDGNTLSVLMRNAWDSGRFAICPKVRRSGLMIVISR